MPRSDNRLAHALERLTNGEQFRAVLASGYRRSSLNFTIRAVPNGLAVPRLGIVARKKIARRAVDRNRGKRLVRELFRLRHEQLMPFDIVVQIKTALRKSSSASLRMELDKLLNQLVEIGVKHTIDAS